VVIREDARGALAVAQQAHAWLSGQLARAWGNERFGEVVPREEVCLAAEQHDLGMVDFDMTPTLNRETGRPHSFMEMPLEVHLAIWEAAPRRMLVQSRHAALLVSMHGVALYGRRDLESMPEDDARRVHALLAGQRELQQELVEALRADPATAPHATEDTIARNQRLIWTLDSLSLALLLDWAPYDLGEVPTAEGLETVRLSADGGAHVLDPWPFAESRLRVRCEGRRLTERYSHEEAMRSALERAPWETLELELTRPPHPIR
jgi:hypothetical protein